VLASYWPIGQAAAVKAILVSLLCLASSACEVAPLSPLHDVEPRDSRAEVDASDGTVDTRGDVTAVDVAETVDETVDSDGAPDSNDVSEPDEGPDSTPLDGTDTAGDSAEIELEGFEDAVESDSTPEVVETLDDASDTSADDTGSDTQLDTLPDVSEETAEVNDASEISDTTSSDVSDITLSDTSLACGTLFTTYVPDPSPHVATCSEVTYMSNPPTSGPHYPIWAAFKSYTNPVNPGFLVHSMEHGAVVIQYRCDDISCDAELLQLATFLAARPVDPLCVEPVRARFVVTPSVTIGARFAVSAWGASLTSDCFDFEALGSFIDNFYAKAPEDFCSPGVDLDTIESGSALYCPPISLQ